MRKKIVAGNWKMNETLQEGVQLAKDINDLLKADKPNCDVVICTPFIHLASVAPVLDKEIVGLGAENCADKEKGAYTGEVSAAMVKSTGADYVILGHSERRQYYHETAEILKEKTLLALKNYLKVIFCCGETLEEREQNKQNEVVKAGAEYLQPHCRGVEEHRDRLRADLGHWHGQDRYVRRGRGDAGLHPLHRR